MGAAQAMEGSERPALQVREHTMDPRQHEMGGRCTDDLGLVVVVGQEFMSRIIYKKVLTVLPSALAGMGGA